MDKVIHTVSLRVLFASDDSAHPRDYASLSHGCRRADPLLLLQLPYLTNTEVGSVFQSSGARI